MATINKPPMLDETGKAIVEELQRLTAVVQPPYKLTTEDKAEIANLVLSNLPAWTGGAY